MKRDAQATRARIAAAARVEFAERGIAGARVDRIAAAAQANKNLIYVYFGSKEELFDAVFAEAITELVTAVPIDAYDLAAYAGAMFDHGVANPELVRLARWHALERPDAPIPSAVDATTAKLAAIAKAQAEGAVNDQMPASDLLAVVTSVTAAWSDGSPEPVGRGDRSPEFIASHRAIVVDTVRRIVAPGG